MSEIEQSFKQTFNNNDRILGVKIRGTDYTLNKPYDHPIVKNQINNFENNLEYLTNTIFLSKCNCSITSQNSTTMSLRLWRSLNNYEYLYIYDLGTYGK